MYEKLNEAFEETKRLFKKLYKEKYLTTIKTDKKLMKYVRIEKNKRCDSIEIFAYKHFDYNYIKIAEKIMKKFQIQHNCEDIEVQAICLKNAKKQTETELRIRLCLNIKRN